MKKVIRTGIIEIDSVKTGQEQWVSAKIQRLEYDDQNNLLSESAREGRLTRRVDQVATQTVDFYDPVTGHNCTLSVAGVGIAIKSMMAKWMLEDFDAHFDSELGAVVLNDSSS